jgi:hypothetical protein
MRPFFARLEDHAGAPAHQIDGFLYRRAHFAAFIGDALMTHVAEACGEPELDWLA